MAYECMGTSCPNFQTEIETIVSGTTLDDGTPFFDLKEDAEKLAPVARAVCTDKGNSMAHLVVLAETDCGSDLNSKFEADPMAFIDGAK